MSREVAKKIEGTMLEIQGNTTPGELQKSIDKLTHIISDLKEEMYMVAVGSSLVGLCEVGLDSSASTTKSSLIDYFVVGPSLAGLCRDRSGQQVNSWKNK